MTIINNKEEIIRILERIIEKSSIINKYQGQIPQIEIDLILSDIRDLYERYYYLNQRHEENEAFENALRRKENEIPEDVTVSGEKNNTTIPLKVVKNEEVNDVAEKQIAIENKTEVPVSDLASGKQKNVAEKFKDDINSINDKIALNKTDTSVASKLNEHPITDIRKGIGINDKFLFIKELFKGNIADYDATINKINTFTSSFEANEYMVSQKNIYNWDEQSEAFINFNKLIERKFM